MKLKKRIAAAAAALMTAIGAMGMCASASTVNYSLRWYNGAPSDVQKTSFSIFVTASGGDRITVNSTTFSTYISGAYASIRSATVDHLTNTANVNSVGKYYLVYTSGTAPLTGTTITVKGTLNNYSTSKGVTANGTLTG